MDPEVNAIIERVLAGEVNAFAEIVRRYQREVWRIAAFALRDGPTTEDLVQQAFVNAYLNLERFDQKRDFGPWLRTIARNLVRQEIRNSQRSRGKLHRYHGHLQTLYADADRAEEYERSLKEALERCREQLAPHAAQALQLRYEQGQDFSTIAATIGRTVAAARQLLNRVRSELRRCIEKGWKVAT